MSVHCSGHHASTVYKGIQQKSLTRLRKKKVFKTFTNSKLYEYTQEG